MENENILPYQNTSCNIADIHLSRYYASLEIRLLRMFGHAFNLCPVIGDGNCLYRALSHIIFGTEICYNELKYNLIRTFRNSPRHTLNVLYMSGSTSEDELNEHFDLIHAVNEWGTNVELTILSALAQIDVLVINVTHEDHLQWRVDDIFSHANLNAPPSVCNPVFNGQRLGVVLHRIHNSSLSYHFDPYYFLAPGRRVLHL